MASNKLRYTCYRSALGDILIASLDGAVTDVAIRGTEAGFVEGLESRWGPGVDMSRDGSSFSGLFTEFDEYFSGKPVVFNTRLMLLGTPFERAVWEVLRDIPRGETRCYGEVASRAGSPGAARAVGRACARNPVPIIVPCHRVVRADGSIGGYSGGVDIKRELLKIEGNFL